MYYMIAAFIGCLTTLLFVNISCSTINIENMIEPKKVLMKNIANQNVTWKVCKLGCEFHNPITAWEKAKKSNFLNGLSIKIKIENGIYNVDDQFITSASNTSNVIIVGNIEDESKVILNFTRTKGNNGNGFAAFNGGIIGLIDGVTIQQPTDGTGAMASTNASGLHTWNEQSYGAGVWSYGSGSNISLGRHVTVKNFYYGISAQSNGSIDAQGGGIHVLSSGDINIVAAGGGVIVCTPCYANDASDITHPDKGVFGANFDAERGGTLYVDGSHGTKAYVAGAIAQSGGAAWFHNMTLIGEKSGNGFNIILGGAAELTGSDVSNFGIGVNVNGGNAMLDNLISHENTGDGIVADGGRISGSNVSAQHNGGFGIHALHNGNVTIFKSLTKIFANKAGNAASDTSGEKNGFHHEASSVFID